jgi:nicotinamidase-related amidase
MLLPAFYDPRNAERFDYAPDQQRLFAEAASYRREHRIAPAAADRFDVHLLLIDVQKDFCFPQGSLYVGGRSGRGALDDNRRLAEFIYRNLASITRTTATLDSHYAFQIFSPSFWIDAAGEPLTPHREITTEQLRRGEVRPNPALSWLGSPAELQRAAEHYCAQLEAAGKYKLWLWPPHCLLGSAGHALAGVVHEARLFHSYVRGAQTWTELKGDNPLTENYSALAPEVVTRPDGSELARRNTALVETLLGADALVIAGQAASHCVKSTVEDLLEEIERRDARLARKVYLLTDCMSAVAVPDGKGGFAADFTPQAEAALARFAAAEMHLVRSIDPMEQWLKR